MAGGTFARKVAGLSKLLPIGQRFAELKQQRAMAFIPFVTAGDPDMPATVSLIRSFAKQGVDIIEVGFPYSDPIADGPVIQASYTRVLERGLHIRDIFAALQTLKGESIPPLVAMVSYAIVFRAGAKAFVSRAKKAGFSGLIVPDLPADEADELRELTQKGGLDLIQLIAPTTPHERAQRILKAASGFIYCISVAGTTGVREALPDTLKTQLQWLHTQTDLPVAVGFGISRTEQVADLRGLADGVIVGSAIVRHLDGWTSAGDDSAPRLGDLEDFVRKMVAAAHVP